MDQGGSRSGASLSLSLRKLCEGNVEGGGSFTGDPGEYVKEGSGDRNLPP